MLITNLKQQLMSSRRRVNFYITLGVAVAAFIWAIPLIWAVSLSLTPNTVLRRITVGLLPIEPTLENYISTLSISQAPRWFFNSVIVAVGTTVGVLILSSLAGYALARIPFKGRRFMLIFIVSGLMVPRQAVFIPLHTMFADWGLHNSHIGLILPFLGLPLGAFLMTQFFKAVPKEIEDAARLDGASHFTIYLRIILPLSRPALTTLGIFTFVNAWNDFLWPLVSATKTDMYTLTIGLASLQGNFAQTEGLGSLMTNAVIASLPILLLFFVFQKYVVEAVKMNAQL